MEIKQGDRFGRWTVTGDRVGRKIMCRCDCGTERSVTISNLRQRDPKKASRSCGCLKREVTGALNRQHGTGYDDYRYRLWRNVKGKCLRETHSDFACYGGRGITIYPPWGG